MAFTPAESRIPTSVGDISIVITDVLSGEDTIQYEVQVKDSIGKVMKNVSGNLVSHLSGAQISGLQALVDSVRMKAQVLIP